MKKLFLLIAVVMLIAGTTTLRAQETSTYYSYKTMLYISNSWETKWRPVGDYTYGYIPMSLTENHLIINAKSPTSFKISGTNVENINTEDRYGKRFRAVELVNDKYCYIEIITYRTTGEITIHVSYMDDNPQIKIVYYIRTNN